MNPEEKSVEICRQGREGGHPMSKQTKQGARLGAALALALLTGCSARITSSRGDITITTLTQ